MGTMPVVQRFFDQVMPDEGPGAREAQPLNDYYDKRVVVILGGPGIGKTTELEQAAAQDTDAVFCKANQFLVDPIARYKGKTIYIDALDEYRAELRPGVTTIDGIRGRLLELGSPTVRISCRTEEWQQGIDVNSLRDVSGGGPVHVLRMLPLTLQDIRVIAAEQIIDVDGFLAGAQERQLIEPLGNPETLKLHLRVYKSGGGWPATRAELMDRSTQLLISEENEIHERAVGDSISDDRLMRAAEDLSAILLFCDKESVALSRAARDNHCIPLHELPGIDLDACRAAARRRLFYSEAPEQVRAQHKTTGDYLAARALAHRIREKCLPLGRALSLLTGMDNRPLSHTRDVHAWLIALLPEHAERLIGADPFGALIYGDVGQWPIRTRRSALKLLRIHAASNDPWFRAGSWYAPSLGALVHPELVDEFREILENEPNPHVTGVILSSLEHGKPLPELGDDLLRFIRDPGRPEHDWLRDDALRAFVHVFPERTGETKVLLTEVISGDIPDDDNMLRAALLSELYPTEIGPDKIFSYISNCNEVNLFGPRTMNWFIAHDLVKKTRDSDVIVLASSVLANSEQVKQIDEFDRRNMNSDLVRRLFELHGDTASPEQIYNWLNIYLDNHYTAYLNEETHSFVQKYLESHPELYTDLFFYWLSQLRPKKNQGYHSSYIDLRNRMLLASPPRNFPEILLQTAAVEPNFDKAHFLFGEAIDSIIQLDPSEYGVGLQLVTDFVERHPAFTEIWDQRKVTPIPDWVWRQAQSKTNRRKGRENLRARNVEILSPRLGDLRTGKDLSNLDFGAKTWFGITQNSKKEDSPFERLERETNHSIAESFLEGFEALLKTASPRSPGEITDLDCQSKRQRFSESFAVLAGADVLAARSMEEFLSLPKNNLKAALAYHLIHSLGSDARTWDKQIMCAHPAITREVLAEIWRAQLAGGVITHLTASFIGRTEDIATPIILSEIPALLDEEPALPPRILENLLQAILHHGDATVLKRLTPKALADRRVRGETRTQWLAVAALMSPDDFTYNLVRRLSNSSRFAWDAHRILIAGAGTLMNGLETVPQLQMSISVLGRYFNNLPAKFGHGFRGSESAEDAARSIRGLIDSLAGLPTAEAAQAFANLVSEPTLHDWQDHLRHSQTIQAKNLREAQFQAPSAQATMTLLAGGAPVGMKDFQVLATDILDDIATDIRGKNANMWKSFWTQAGKGKLDKPKIENDSRDAMLPWIRPYLSSREISIEPEGAAADQKRVDIRLTHAKIGTLPIEVKRDDNTELWTAMRDQLLARYTNDPSTGGYGVYVVLWYGIAGNGCQSPPTGFSIETPKSASELQAALEKIKPDTRFVVRVIDVTKPHE